MVVGMKAKSRGERVGPVWRVTSGQVSLGQDEAAEVARVMKSLDFMDNGKSSMGRW